MKQKYVLVLLSLLQVFISPAPAQTRLPLVEEYQVALSFGNRSVRRLPTAGAYLDFMNHLIIDEPDLVAYQYIGLYSSLKFRDNWRGEVHVALLDFTPCFVLQSQRMFGNLGINGGVLVVNQIMNGYEQYYRNKTPGLPTFANQKFRTVWDIGYFLGPTYRIERTLGFIQVKANLGFSSTQPFSETFRLAVPNSNFRQEIIYKTEREHSFFISPEIVAGVFIFKGKNSKLGVLGRFVGFQSNVNIPYQKSEYTWTQETIAVETVKPRRNRYRRLDYEIGLVMHLQ
ncbi:MAG: hypothetical protein WBA23_02235 [Tunicatimonas sp.]|uniref:hypothetical protein n=1 Tax=Tunicatimonas sp. TaxID=1940096 RepID=UPI003C762731